MSTRASQRYGVDLELELDSGAGFQPARARNASLGGVFIETEQRPQPGARLMLRLRLPGSTIEVPGVVRWQDDRGIGVQFDGLRAKDVYALGKFFEARG